MAFTLIAHASAAPVLGVTTAGPIDTTGAKLIVITTGQLLVISDVAPTDNKGNIYTPRTPRGIAYLVQSWECINPIVGVGHTFSITGGTINIYPAITVQAWSATGAIIFDSENGNGTPGFATIQTGPVSPIQNNELIITAALTNQAGAVTSINSGFTVTDIVPHGSPGPVNCAMGMAYLLQGTAAVVNPTWAGNQFQAATILCYRELPVAVVLTLSSGSAAPGTPITLTVSIASTGGAAPSAVQWVIGFPLGSISGITAATVGAAATTASKALTQLGNNFEIEGPNINVIGDGVIANLTFQLTLNNNPIPNPIPIQILSVQASDINGNLIPSAGALGDVTALTLSTACPLNAATIGAPYFAALAGAGGTAPYTWMVASGLLPPGITLDTSTGVFNGIATALGTFSFVIEIMDVNGVIFLTGGCHIVVTGVTPTNPNLCDNPVTDVTMDCYCELTKVLVAFKPNKRLPVRGRS